MPSSYLNFEFPEKYFIWNFLCCDYITFMLMHVLIITIMEVSSFKYLHLNIELLAVPVNLNVFILVGFKSHWPHKTSFKFWLTQQHKNLNVLVFNRRSLGSTVSLSRLQLPRHKKYSYIETVKKLSMAINPKNEMIDPQRGWSPWN